MVNKDGYLFLQTFSVSLSSFSLLCVFFFTDILFFVFNGCESCRDLGLTVGFPSFPSLYLLWLLLEEAVIAFDHTDDYQPRANSDFNPTISEINSGNLFFSEEQSMATYFQVNPDIQATDGLQTLVLRNPGYVQLSDALPPPPTNLFFFNSLAGNALASQSLPHAPPSQSPQFSGMPLPVSLPPTSQDPNSHPTHPHHISALHGFIPGAKFNHWNPISSSSDARESQRATQGLSLSLSSQQPGYGLFRAERDHSSPSQLAGEEIRVSGGSSSISGNTIGGVSGLHGVLLCSKYLKAAQELLEEVVNVSTDGIKNDPTKKPTSTKIADESSRTATEDASVRIDPAGKESSELTMAEKQEIQMKKAKLISMLDEVEQRYRQYHHQMQIVVSSFEQSTGIGSARTYTSLALETISKQFRCLKDTISGQIKAANKSLGEEDWEGGKIGSSRLKFVDHQLRQQRALQQLGMIQQNAWRPQRGLPERSVSVLRAWLFEHFLHPYPKDSDKQMLAKQTGLTRSQVSNWFINARVRLWKPMVEEMYKEEIKDHEHNGSAENMSMINENSPPNSISPREKAPPRKILEGHSIKTATKSAVGGGNIQNSAGSRLPGSSKLEDILHGSSSKKQKQTEMTMHSPPNAVSSINIDGKQAQSNQTCIETKVGHEKQTRDEYSFLMNQANFAGGFGEYPIGRIDRYNNDQFTPRFSANGVSLTLGLPHHNFLPNPSIHVGRQIEIGEPNEFSGMNSSTSHSATAFDNIDIQNRKQFVAQLLPNFAV